MNLTIATAAVDSLAGDLSTNLRKTVAALDVAAEAGCDTVFFSGLSLSGHPLGELTENRAFVSLCALSFDDLLKETQKRPDQLVIVSHTDPESPKTIALFAVKKGTVLAKLPLSSLSDGRETPVSASPGYALFEHNGTRCALLSSDVIDSPSLKKSFAENPVSVAFVADATRFSAGSLSKRIAAVRHFARSNRVRTVCANRLGSNGQLVYDGSAYAIDDTGAVKTFAPLFSEHTTRVDFAGENAFFSRMRQQEIYDALVFAVRSYCRKCGFPKVVLGMSGGADSALVCAIAADAMGPENVTAIMMPSRFTSDESLTDARDMAERLNVRYLVLPIAPPVSAVEETLASVFEGKERDITEENLQARMRGMLLMAYSNKFGALVLTTGNKSESAVGYCTLYGDTVGGLAVIKDVYKTAVYELLNYRNSVSPVVPGNIMVKAPSAELRENQRDEDSLPPYHELDAILTRMLEGRMSAEEIIAEGYVPDTVRYVFSLVRKSSFKRAQCPPGVCVSPRPFDESEPFPAVGRFTG